MIGYATINAEGFNGTTGGEGGEVSYASSMDEIQAFVECSQNANKEILIITASIESDKSFQFKFSNGANLTIRGEFGVSLKNFGFYFDNYNNVIIENLEIHEVFYPNDPITINNSHHFCIRNNELYSIENPTTYKDTYDGLIDIKRGSRYITIDSNYLRDHNKCLLIGHTDDPNQKEQDSKISITICNNLFENIRTRCPSIRYGTLHIFNNKYLNIPYDYAIAARCGARVLIENNIFDNVKHALSTKFRGEKPFVKLSENNQYFGLYSDDKKNVRKHIVNYKNQLSLYTDSGFVPPYEYEYEIIKR